MQDGFILPVCLILLLVISVVATGAMQASRQESHLASNVVERAEAFESSESIRRMFEPVLHAAIAGDSTTLTAAAGTGWTLVDPSGAALKGNDDESGNCATPFVRADGTPCTLRIDATYVRDVASPGESPVHLRGTIAVFRLRSTDAGESYFYVESRGESTGARGPTQVKTAAIVRHVGGGTVVLVDGAPVQNITSSRQNGEIDWREAR
jgi:Tfp pilus assembly protein PilX